MKLVLVLDEMRPLLLLASVWSMAGFSRTGRVHQLRAGCQSAEDRSRVSGVASPHVRPVPSPPRPAGRSVRAHPAC